MKKDSDLLIVDKAESIVLSGLSGMTKIALAVLLIAALGWLGGMSYQEELQQQEVYCKMVGEGRWPDYQGTFESECKEGTDER